MVPTTETFSPRRRPPTTLLAWFEARVKPDARRRNAIGSDREAACCREREGVRRRLADRSARGRGRGRQGFPAFSTFMELVAVLSIRGWNTLDPNLVGVLDSLAVGVNSLGVLGASCIVGVASELAFRMESIPSEEKHEWSPAGHWTDPIGRAYAGDLVQPGSTPMEKGRVELVGLASLDGSGMKTSAVPDTMTNMDSPFAPFRRNAILYHITSYMIFTDLLHCSSITSHGAVLRCRRPGCTTRRCSATARDTASAWYGV